MADRVDCNPQNGSGESGEWREARCCYIFLLCWYLPLIMLLLNSAAAGLRPRTYPPARNNLSGGHRWAALISKCSAKWGGAVSWWLKCVGSNGWPVV